MSKKEAVLLEDFPTPEFCCSNLQEVVLSNFENSAGNLQDVVVTLQFFGRAPGKAPVVLVNHPLTGNSQVTGKNGWWKELVGPDKAIDTNHYTVLALDMPGNEVTQKNHHLLHHYREFTLRDFAKMYLRVLDDLEIHRLFAAIGGSIGGALAWELAAIRPNLIEHLIPIATDFKVTDWLLAYCKVQDQILNHSSNPVRDARMHAMPYYRTPQSFKAKFNPEIKDSEVENNVSSWLSHHGTALEGRFCLASYKLMNHLLSTIDISGGTGKHIEAAKKIKACKHIITINSDLLFLAEENWDTYVDLACSKAAVTIHEIESMHGHDAFLIEHNKLSKILKPLFNPQKPPYEKDQHCAVRSR